MRPPRRGEISSLPLPKDAVTLERDRVNDEGKLFLYRAKTGVAVYVPIPPDVVELLESLPNSNPAYFFWSGNGDPQTACKGWRRSLDRLFRIAKIRKRDGTPKRCHAHMLRDTFAVELLNRSVPIDRVSLLLGHSSVKVTEKHYAPFVKERQLQLENYARRAWDDAKSAPTSNPGVQTARVSGRAAAAPVN
jgi:integrase/recombinase XerD